MLPFQNEQGYEDNPSDIKQTAVPDDTSTDRPAQQQQQQTEPDDEYLTVADRDKNVRKSTILLVVLFGTGLLCLWFMIKKSGPQTTSAATVSTEEARIENALAGITGIKTEMFGRMDEIVHKFYEFSEVPQVKASELVKNPFRHDIFIGATNIELDTEQNDAETGSEDMQLSSIMQSQQGNCCMIDDKILYEGDSIRGFKVCQIGSNFVTLEQRSIEGAAAGDKQKAGARIVLKLLE